MTDKRIAASSVREVWPMFPTSRRALVIPVCFAMKRRSVRRALAISSVASRAGSALRRNRTAFVIHEIRMAIISAQSAVTTWTARLDASAFKASA